MKKNYTSNDFKGGIVLDINPLTVPEGVLTNALNATYITRNGNEYSLQNDMGNAKVTGASLDKGYVPVGTCELGGILYIASYNPETGKGLIGSFPSPQYENTSDSTSKEIILLDLLEEFDYSEITNFPNNINSVYKSTNIPFIEYTLDPNEFLAGDLFYVQESSGVPYLNYELFTKSGNRKINLKECSIHNNNSESYDIFSNKNSGTLEIRIKLNELSPITLNDIEYDIPTVSGKKLKLSINSDSSNLYGHIFLKGNDLKFVSDNEFIAEYQNNFKGLIFIKITPIYKYGEDVYIVREDLSYSNTIDCSKIGLNIVNELWKYNKYDDGVDIMFDIQDYLREGYNIADVKFQYLNHKYLKQNNQASPEIELIKDSKFKENIGVQIEDFEFIEEETILLFPHPDNGFYDNVYKIYYDGALTPLFEIEDNNLIVKLYYYWDSKFSYISRNIPFDINDYTIDIREFDIYLISGDYKIHWNIDKGDVTVEYTGTLNDDEEPSVEEQYIKYVENDVEYYLFVQRGNLWYKCDSIELTPGYNKLNFGTECYDFGILQNQYTFLKENDLIPATITKDGNEITFEYSDLYFKFYIKSSIIINPIDPDDVNPNNNDWNSSNNKYESDWITYSIDTRRYSEGIYKVSIPFSDTFIANSLYIIRIIISTTNQIDTKEYQLNKVLFTNGMYNELYLNTEIKDFDNFSIELSPIIDYNLLTEIDIQQESDTIEIDAKEDQSISTQDKNKIKKGLFSTAIYDKINPQATETLKLKIIITSKMNPSCTLDFGFNVSGFSYSVKENSYWNFPDNVEAQTRNNELEFKLTNTISNIFNLNYTSGLLRIENYYKPIVYQESDLLKQALIHDDTSNRITSIYPYEMNGNKHVSRFAGLGFVGGGEDEKGGGNLRFMMANFPLSTTNIPVNHEGEVSPNKFLQGYNIVSGVEERDYKNNDSNNGKGNPDLILTDAFGNVTTINTGDEENPEYTITAGSYNKSQVTKTNIKTILDNEPLKFPDSDFTDMLRDSSGIGSKYPLIIPVVMVPAQRDIFSAGLYPRYFTKGYDNTANEEDRFNNIVYLTKFRTLWLFGLTYVDGEYHYVPLNTFMPIYSGDAVIGTFSFSNWTYTIHNTNSTIGEYILSYLASIYYKGNSENKYTETLGYVSSFSSSTNEETEITHELQAPVLNVNGNLHYDGNTQQVLQNRIKYYFKQLGKQLPECMNFKLQDTSKNNIVSINYTYVNPKYKTYQSLSNNIVQNYASNLTDDVILDIPESDEELYIREEKTDTLIPVSYKTKYRIPLLKPYYSKFNKLINSFRYSDSALEYVSNLEYNLNHPYVIDDNPVTIEIPQDLLRYLNDKLFFDFNTYKNCGERIVKFEWKRSDNKDARKTNKLKIGDFLMFSNKFNADSLPLGERIFINIADPNINPFNNSDYDPKPSSTSLL